MELTTTWKEEGRREGQQAEALHLTVRLLTRRFGTIESELEQRISKLSLVQLPGRNPSFQEQLYPTDRQSNCRHFSRDVY
jgi:hypothetical protein